MTSINNNSVHLQAVELTESELAAVSGGWLMAAAAGFAAGVLFCIGDSYTGKPPAGYYQDTYDRLK